MHLKLRELQAVVKNEMKKDKSFSALREELFRVLGPSVMVSHSYGKVFEAANEQLDYLEATGRNLQEGVIKTSLLIEAAGSDSIPARKLAARLLPLKFAKALIDDASASVRSAAAKRLPYSIVSEAVKRNPSDESLRLIARDKRIAESGVAAPKPVTEPFDMYGEEPMGAASKTPVPDDDLTDAQYDRWAHKLCQMYGGNLERQWEEIAATRHVASHYASTGVKLDRDKLLKKIYDCLDARDEAVMEEGSLKALASKMLSESSGEEAFMPIIEEEKDPVKELLESNYSSSRYVTEAETLFNVRKSYLPPGIKKYRLGEGIAKEVQVPMKATVPGSTIGVREEKALDLYVKHWNDQQARRGEPFKISWSQHPSGVNLVGFNLELK
jgi:hypothetical protein